MKIFESMATILAYSSLGVFLICAVIISILNLFGFSNFGEKFDKFYFKAGTYFCLPLYGFSFVSEGISEKIENRNPILSFVLAIIFFLIALILINHRKIQKIIERRKILWKFWR